ncbi:class I SAM-dependent methyltransferase [bacterium]|nr:class I SAM-dependent methyltransferase [candidate division CSSED10-310 bacterium]
MSTIVKLHKGSEKSLLRRHPWIFSGAVADVSGHPEPGETVDVIDSSGCWLARGGYSPTSKIRIRVWTFDPAEEPGFDLFIKRLNCALDWRRKFGLLDGTTAFRWINGEADGFPGLIVDRYGEFAVCQFLSAAADIWKEAIVTAIRTVASPAGIFERSDSDIRKLEGLRLRTGCLDGDEPPDRLEIREAGIRFLVDIRAGHKTGFYLDQRINRFRVARYARDANVLNCFSYTGGFGAAALTAGARHVTHVDSSFPAMELAVKTMELNNLRADRFSVETTDVFGALRNYRDLGRRFDMIVLDPPKFAESRRQVPDAVRAYKDINLAAMHLLNPGGILATFSCSGAMDRSTFHQTIAFAAKDAGRDALIMESLEQCPDHPYSTAFPEGFYLKGMVLRV